MPILVVAALLARADDIGVYEDGTFVPVLGSDTVERLVRNPDRFAVRNYALRGPRAAFLGAVAEELSVGVSGRSRSRVGTAIALVTPLLRRVRNLPPYALKTRTVSDEAAALRSAVLRAREPDELLFAELPIALGLPAISASAATSPAGVKAFCDGLSRALHDLESAYGRLLDDLEAAVSAELGAPVGSVQHDLRVRAERLLGQVIDPALKAFTNALANRNEARAGWLEQLGMVLARTAPPSWSDDDRVSALQSLSHLALSFRRVESLHFSQAKIGNESFNAVRVAITMTDGVDISRVVWADESARPVLKQLTDETLALARKRLGARGPEMLLAELAAKTLPISTASDVERHVREDVAESAHA
jgi:hypothetical protein